VAASLNIEIDDYDTAILSELQLDARLSMAELGRRVHLSQPAVTERVRKLETAGVITGYRATVNAAKLGYGIRAIVRAGRCEWTQMIKLIDTLPEVIKAHSITGGDSWLLEIVVRDVAHLDAVLWALKGLTDTSTTVVLRTPRENAVILPPRDLAHAAGRHHAKKPQTIAKNR
jgi:Lrp/AsnC family transcriptional regulator, leucine-responsive regulatory protein